MVADGPDTSVIRPSDWNAEHDLTGLQEALDAKADATVIGDIAAALTAINGA